MPRTTFTFMRNRSSFVIGASWSHHPSFSVRSVHIYLGVFLLTIRRTPRFRPAESEEDR